MNVPVVVQRHRTLRWLLPAAVVAAAGLAATGSFSAFSARASSDDLPATTAGRLLSSMSGTSTAGLSGTVVSTFALGLPELPSNLGGGSAGAAAGSALGLLAGSHTLEVWYGGRTRQRIALLGASDETDLFRSGRTVWLWSSSAHTARRVELPSTTAATFPVPAASLTPAASALPSLTPSAMASAALAALDPTTRVRVLRHKQVADRSAYELVLTPRQSDTRVGSVHISVDGATKVPLGVQVYARGAGSPAIDVAFTSVRFGAQSDSLFHFTPPRGTTVHRAATSDVERSGYSPLPARTTSPASAGLPGRPAVDVTGAGWSQIVELGRGTLAASSLPAGVLAPVSGSWGSGRLLDSALFSALVTTDGRVFVGAVDPAALYAAAGR